MGWWGVGLALMLPWLAGALWVRSGWRDDPAGIWPMALGYGYLLGMLVVTLLLRLQEALGLPPSFAGPAVVMAILTTTPIRIQRERLDIAQACRPFGSAAAVHSPERPSSHSTMGSAPGIGSSASADGTVQFMVSPGAGPNSLPSKM